MIQRRAPLPKFNPGDHVRMIDNSPAIVVGRVAPKSYYYIVDSQLYGRCTVFAGELDKDNKQVVPTDPDTEML